MIKKFVDRFMAAKPHLESVFSKKHPDDYADIVKAVVSHISEDRGDEPDPGRIHQINDGDYQGTLLFVIAERGYQPDKYWCVSVGYGSCSGCDTLESIRQYNSDVPTPKQVRSYMTLALHIVQGLRQCTGFPESDEPCLEVVP